MAGSTNSSTPIVVLHAFRDESGGAAWRDALVAADWEGPVVAPDLPGHCGAPAPVGGHYEVADTLLAVLPLLAGLDPDLNPPIVVGCGVNGWAAHVLALAGRASALVAVDGLGGPWTTPRQRVTAWRDTLRSIANDPDAMAAPPAEGMDPRLRYGLQPHGSRRLAERGAVAMPVPALIVESPASPLPAEEVDALAAAYRSGATVERVTAATAAAATAVIGRWASTLRSAAATPCA